MKKIKLLVFALICVLSLNAQKTNVVFILVDDLKPMLNAFGESQIVSPNFDAFASQSVTFTNTYCQQAICAPSRVSFMTGMRPDYTQVFDLKTHMRDKVPNSLTIPEYFKQNGYTTAGLGKVLHGAKNNDPQSWSIPFITDKELTYSSKAEIPVDYQYQNANTRAIYNKIEPNKNGKIQNVRGKLKNLGGRPSVECIDVPDDAYVDGAIALKSIELLKKFKKDEKPFFLTIGFRKPHLPFTAPAKYWDLYKRNEIKLAEYQKEAEGSPAYAYHSWGELKAYADIPENIDANGRVVDAKQRELIHGYYACVSYVDAQLGLVLNYLEESGLKENTLVVLIGDHGWHLGDHGMWNKHSNFEQATRTPMIIMSPKGKKGIKNSSPVELIDVFPTMCEITKLETPKHLHGKSLNPIVKGKKNKVKNVAMSQYPRNGKMGYAVRSERYRYVEWRTGNYKKTKDYKNGELAASELYDYETDPLETKNLVNDPAYAEIVRELQAEMNSLLK